MYLSTAIPGGSVEHLYKVLLWVSLLGAFCSPRSAVWEPRSHENQAICVPAGWVGTICCIYIYFSVFSISSDLVFLWGGMMVVCCMLVFFPWWSRLTSTEVPTQIKTNYISCSSYPDLKRIPFERIPFERIPF